MKLFAKFTNETTSDSLLVSWALTNNTSQLPPSALKESQHHCI